MRKGHSVIRGSSLGKAVGAGGGMGDARGRPDKNRHLLLRGAPG